MKWIMGISVAMAMGYGAVLIATGPKGGTYYQIGKDIATVCGKELEGLQVAETAGSVDNLKKMARSSKYKFAIVQYDVLIRLKEKAPRLAKKFKIVTPLYGEEIHLITLKSNPINNLSDLKGKKIVVGSKNSGDAVTAAVISNLTKIKFKKIFIPVQEGLVKLLQGKVDGVLMVGGAPMKILDIKPSQPIFSKFKEVISISPAVGEGQKLEDVYYPTTITTSQYQWLDGDVKTREVESVLISYNSKEGSKDYKRVQKLYQCLSDNLPRLKSESQFHPKWEEVNLKGFDRVKWDIHPAVEELTNLNNPNRDLIQYFKNRRQ